MAAVVALELAVTVLVPLFVGTVSVIHGLRGAKPNVGRSVLTAAGIWAGIGIGTVAIITYLARAGLSL